MPYNAPIEIVCVSWISPNGLPGPVTAVTQFGKHEMLVVSGLASTANDVVPQTIPSFADFEQHKDFRALLGFTVHHQTRAVTQPVLNPGYTPPAIPIGLQDTFDLALVTYKSGEAATDSAVISQRGTAHRWSTMPAHDEKYLLGDGVLKFRAGASTNNLGAWANAKHHVPWVWCELAAFEFGGRLFVELAGSVFPSHSLYVNGTLVDTLSQDAITPGCPALTSGKSREQFPQQGPVDVAANGPVNTHEYAVKQFKRRRYSLDSF